MFPARSARTQLRLTTIALFRSRRAVYQDTVASRGIAVANSLAEGSYKEALEDYSTFCHVHIFSIARLVVNLYPLTQFVVVNKSSLTTSLLCFMRCLSVMRT